MLKYLLDTDIAIYTIKSRPATVKAAFEAHYGQIGISTITLMELVYGAETSSNPPRNLRDIEGFAARLEVRPYDDAAAIHTGQIRAHLAKLGQPIGPLYLKARGD
ncbi:MAG: PIN domain-containing protein [Candidatus Competibacteraceae bacterium]|nr:PIN domain-containing protein [Candidatus Competibacteraceae bacterium]